MGQGSEVHRLNVSAGISMKHFRVPAAPFACFDEHGLPADDRVQDFAQRCVDAALEVAEAVDDFSPAEFALAIRLMQARRNT
jgi:hypothetical protein